ncbi:hypothetical protein [Ramlibacter rhizophilus]|uniref:Uncharacterized protein n=1 Tax=Ramlibacter rhizophilus TaxID=1781167 RepID=A0A4Z0BYL6_9BURK|nr:hypothetical protein [Ramlibacter rhizophilus]TFZ03390.1 hypothetical protein EZ242_05775 [Ramlibacter rhizophilus]
MNHLENKGREYRVGELELILSLPPTKTNIAHLATSLGRSESAISIVYKIAYQPDAPFGSNADIQRQKIEAAKTQLGFMKF